MSSPDTPIDPNSQAATRPDARPNFVIIVTDEMPGFAAGYAGDPNVDTPNLDRLAARSTDYRNAFVANPICMPNRASILSGLLPSSHGTRINGIPLSPHVATFTDQLRLGGYRTAAVGKLHHQPYGAPLGALVAALDSVPADDAWAHWEHRSAFEDADIQLPDPYYGFEHTDLVIGAGDTATGNYRHWLLDHGVDPATMTGYANAVDRLDDWNQVYRSPLPAELTTTAYITERSIAEVERLAGSQAPFALWVSYPDPHHPFCPPTPWYDRYSPDEIELDPSTNADHIGTPAHIRQMWDERGRQRRPYDCWAPTEPQLRAALAAAYGMISQVDEAVGQILSTLDRVGIADNTIVVFTSDHGDMFGHHGLLLKHLVHYDSCIRVPLLVHVPQQPARRVDEMVSSLDIAPSTLAAAGLPGLAGAHGVDLGWGGDIAPPERTGLLIEEDELFGGAPQIAIRTLHTGRYRYTRYRPGGDELYDLAVDPQELVNRANDPEYRSVRSDLVEAMLDETIRLRDRSIVPSASA